MNETETEPGTVTADNPLSLDEFGSSATINTEALPVTLVFVAGETEIELGDLRGLAPGYVFALPRPVDRHVEIRANGRTIGSGELVEIDGRIGVRVLACSLRGSD